MKRDLSDHLTRKCTGDDPCVESSIAHGLGVHKSNAVKKVLYNTLLYLISVDVIRAVQHFTRRCP